MIGDKAILAIIPARGGSVGVPRKNIRAVAGKPLLAWTIEEAKKSKYIDRLILSSEDPEIISVARRWGCEVPFVRPSELAQNHVTGIDPILHAIQTLSERYDYVVVLQPTSPLRIAEDIEGCIEKCIDLNKPACVTVSMPDKSPYWMYHVDENEILKPVLPQKEAILLRQKLERVYALNGAVYVAKIDWFLENKRFIGEETAAYIMPRERSLDIDDELDLRVFEAIISKRGKRQG